MIRVERKRVDTALAKGAREWNWMQFRLKSIPICPHTPWASRYTMELFKELDEVLKKIRQALKDDFRHWAKHQREKSDG